MVADVLLERPNNEVPRVAERFHFVNNVFVDFPVVARQASIQKAHVNRFGRPCSAKRADGCFFFLVRYFFCGLGVVLVRVLVVDAIVEVLVVQLLVLAIDFADLRPKSQNEVLVLHKCLGFSHHLLLVNALP